MSNSNGIKNLFNKTKVVSSSSLNDIARKIESPEYVQEFLEDRKRFFPNVDFSNPINFARFGSAEEYYKKSIENIYKTYPYDGSLKEKYEWHNDSSYLDNYIFEHEYPRTTGYITLGQNWGSINSSDTVNATADGDSIYKKSTTPQYIYVKGGPNPASHLTYELDNPLESPDYKKKRFKANYYNTTSSQDQNLNIDGTSGNTIEFWLKLPSSPETSQTSPAHAYFDLWNNETIGDHTYGRILVETILDVDGGGSPDGSYLDDSIFYVSYASGSSGVQRAKIGPSTFPSSENITLSDWNHYAFVMQNNLTGSDHLLLKMYVNGILIDTVHTGSQIQAVGTGPFNANIGAYRGGPTTALAAAGVGNGHGSLSGSSIDEFRFWKTARNSEQVGLHWFKQVAGGTNSDFGNNTSKYSGSLNPVDLGVYYKFNEGITGIANLDSNVLDYSGRVSNGSIQNYNASPSMRSTDSAIVVAGAAEKEFKDPILYKNHPSITTYYNESLLKGLEYDNRNSMGMYRMMPQWMLDEDSQKDGFKLRELTQIMSSYFDELFIQTKEMSKLKDITYVSGSLTGSFYKPLPFANRLLTSHGFAAPELFANADVLAALGNRDREREYEKTLFDVKNQLYTNVYNNLSAINKSKGTEKSIRNLLRSLGVDTELYSINFYANNAEVTLNQSILPVTVEKNFVDFTMTGSFGGTVYQSSASSNTNSVTFLTGSDNQSGGFDREMGFTVETEVVFPRQLKYENPAFGQREYIPLTASLFGMHTAEGPTMTDVGDTTWATDDCANFQVFAVKNDYNRNGLNVVDDEVYFVLTSTNGGVFSTIQTEKFTDVYENQKWTFAVKVLPETYPNLGFVSGTTGHRIEFHGYSAIGDQIVNSFNLSSNISQADGAKFLSRKKRIYIGAHRQNFTGSVLQSTNVKISACRYWALPLETDEIIAHTIDASNYGLFAPQENAYLFQDFKINVPKMDTLALNWEFSTLTGSDSNGDFEVPDLSYGTGDNRYGSSLSGLLEKQHTGRGYGFVSNDTSCITKDFLYAYKQQVPDNLDISDTIKVLDRDDEMFTPRTKPVKFSMSIEKSMYEVISEEMLNFMAACVDASALETLVGRGVNKYRDKYKALEKVRNLFYEKISNTPDLDKYLEYYSWLDGAISEMIGSIVPMSSGFKDIENVVESHVLERNKYQHRFPTMEFKSSDPEGIIKGINELVYDWEFGHAPYPETVGRHATGTQECLPIFSCAVTTPIIFTSTTDINSAASRNGEHIQFDVLAASDNPTDTILVSFVSIGTPRTQISIQVTPNDGTYNSGIPVNITSAEIVELINNGSVAGKNVTITDSSSVRTLQTATGGDGTNLANGGEGDSSRATFSGGVNAGSQYKNCNWWNKKALRSESYLEIGDSDVDFGRMNIHSASLQVFNRDFNKPYKMSLREEGLKTRLKKKSVVLSELKPFDNSRSITFDTTTFVSSSQDCTDDLKINPNLKRKADFQVQLSDGTNTQSKYSGDLIVPYSFYSSSVSNPATGVPTGYQVGFEHLRDYYVDTKEVPMQGPFTQQHVGGNQHRNVGLVYKPIQLNGPSDPRKDYVPQAWYALATLAGGHLFYTILNPSYFGADFTRASFTRDFIAKRPVNIKNIKTVTTSFSSSYGSVLPIGNYVNSYEMVQMADRSVNSRYFVENNGISTEAANSPVVLGLKEYTVPDRGRHSSIMVNRFSAPGGPEVSSPGYLDAESETYSVYNALPYRNLTVRQPLKSFLTAHSLFGGYSSLYGEPSASYHKVQRNGAKRIEYTIDKVYDPGFAVSTASAYDNYWVQHIIPQSDLQYSWITASAVSFPFGYSQPDPSNASEAATDITFVGASDFGTYGSVPRYYGLPEANGASSWTPIDFVGLNNVFTADSTQFGDNTLELSLNDLNNTVVTPDGLPAVLNAGLLLLNGPYGHPSWKQVRQSYNPIVRYMHKNNVYSILKETKLGPGPAGGLVYSKQLINYTEPPVSFKNHPLIHDFVLDTNVEIILKSTYQNNLQRFGNPAVTNVLNYSGRYKGEEIYDDLKRIYIDGDLNTEQSSIKKFNSMKYKETVFPMDKNTGLGKVRGRENYTVSSGSSDFNLALGESVAFWKNNIKERHRSDAIAKNASSDIITSGSAYLGLLDLSIWPLNATEPFFDLYQATSSVDLGQGFGGETLDGHYLAPLGVSGGTLNSTYEPRFNNVAENGELSHAGYIYNLLLPGIQGRSRYNGAATASAPIDRGYLTGSTTISPSASLQFEYPNLVPSGTSEHYSDEWLAATYASNKQTLIPSGNLHLIPPYKTAEISGRAPWFNSYEDYSEDIRRMAKEYSVLPEYKVSDYIDHYLENGIKADTNNFLKLEGNTLSLDSANTTGGEINNQFFKVYSHSDFLSSFKVFKEDHSKNSTGKFRTVKIDCHGIKKLLPYQGFYPALRSIQLGALFSSSFGKEEYLDGSSLTENPAIERLAALYQPFFAPGVFYNTIKSGIAVSYPIHTEKIDSSNSLMQGDGTTVSGKNAPKGYYLQPGTGTIGPRFACNVITDFPTSEIPFEAILDPSKGLSTSKSMYFVYPHMSGSVHRNTYADGFYLNQSETSKYPASTGQNINAVNPRDGLRVRWKGTGDINYILAANNFFAETENFFLEQRAPVNFVSKPENKFRPMKAGTKYYMDIVLYKTDKFMSYEVPSGSFDYNVYPYKDPSNRDDRNKVIHEIGDGKMVLAPMSVRGMHYGPPYAFSTYFMGLSGTGSVGDGVQVNMALEDPAYAPHCPPYFYGVSRARVVFDPALADTSLATGDSRKFSLEEIFGYARINSVYSNDYDTLDGWLRYSTDSIYTNTPASVGQMHITSSVDIFKQKNTKLFNYEPVPQATVDAFGNTLFVPTSVQDYPTEGLDRQWVIESRFECPSINVYDMDTEALGAGSPGDGRNAAPGSERLYTKGIWKGFGSPPTAKEGIFLELRESYPEFLGVDGDNPVASRSGLGYPVGSLIKACGFGNNSKRKLGEIASKRKMYEAVVAVPVKRDGTFYGIERKIFLKQLFNVNNGKPAVAEGDFGSTSNIDETSISDMIGKMKKYNIPPQMNFVEFGDIDPFVMYIFEFEHEFSKNDLSLIWQNVMPDIAVTAEKQTYSLEHPIGSQFEFYGKGKNAFQPETRWMIFKIKQRAKNNYSSISVASDEKNGFNQAVIGTTKQMGLFINGESDLRYSYNWPYDFCSLVELAKVDVESTFGPETEDIAEETERVETITKVYDRNLQQYIETDKRLQETKRESLKQTPRFNDTRVGNPFPQQGTTTSGNGFVGGTTKKTIK